MPPRKSVVAIGMFDGVHAGHQRLIRATVRLAARLRADSVALTFDPDPQAVLSPGRVPPKLMPLSARLELLTSLGIGRVHVIRFTRAFSKMPAPRFIERILVQRLAASGVIVGRNFAFGQGRRGGLPLLRKAGARQGFRVVVVRPVVRSGAVVSSSRIRALLSRGRIAQASRLLGRPAQLYGTVVKGAGRAATLGFPTANVRLEPGLCLPPLGVYRVELWHGRHRRAGLMNLGVRPTFSSAANGHVPVVCEVHVPGFRGTLYGREVRVDILQRLRDERRFSSSRALIQQIRRDLRRAFARH